MVMRDDPYMSSIEKRMDYAEIGQKPLSEMPKIMLDLTSGNLDSTLDLDSHKDLIYIGVRHIIKTYENSTTPGGSVEENVRTDHYRMIKCTEEFYETDFEKQYYKEYQQLNPYCIEDPRHIYLEGTRESSID